MATQGTGLPVTLTTSAAAIATAGVNELVTVVRIQAYNSDTVSRLVTVYQVPSGGTAGASNLVHTQTVYRNASTSIDVAGLMVSAGASIQAKADAGAVVNLSANLFRSDQAA